MLTAPSHPALGTYAPYQGRMDRHNKVNHVLGHDESSRPFFGYSLLLRFLDALSQENNAAVPTNSHRHES
jgi:hypothetical protein